MRRISVIAISASVAFWLASVSAFAQAPLPGVGNPITLEQARKVAAATEAEAKKNNWNMVIVIVEPNGTPVYYLKMDGAQYGSVKVAMDKAKSSALFRRPTTAFEAGLKAGNTYLLQLADANAVPGGRPIVADGKVIGGIGVSGATGAQDDQCAAAGVAALN
ncbi:MAG: heme-binding protein [Xanthobacteraceae bacterium]